MTKKMLVSDQAQSIEAMNAISDEYSRKILVSTISKSLSVDEISQEMHIPVSTCYRRIHALEISGMMRKDRTIISEDGKKTIRYK
jgi:predicted transcriptional regulator